MECLSDFLDRKAALEPGWGGPGEVKALLDDGVPQALARKSTSVKKTSGYSVVS